EADVEIKIEPGEVAQPASESDSDVQFVSERQMTPSTGKRRASGSGGRARKARRRASRFVVTDSDDDDDDEFQDEDAEATVSVEQGPRRTSGRVKGTTNYDEVDYFEKRGIH
ncbi:hypothetical protein PC116_g32682, partial [Phytophthora cactorum]